MDKAPPSPPHRRRRWLRITALVLFVVIALPLTGFVAWQWYERAAAEKQLRAAVERTTQHDPRWRLDEIEADRVAVPDEENAAPRVRAARKLLPERWPPSEFGRDWYDIPPTARLRADQESAIRNELQKHRPALEEARRLKDHGRGRFPIEYAANPFDTRVEHVHEARDLAVLLEADALLRAQEGDIDGALDSCRAIINAGRTLGDEPFLISILVRLATRSVSLRCLERVLARGEAPATGLARAQELLQAESKENLLLQGLRGERASLHETSLQVEEGHVALESLGPNGPGRSPQGWERVSNLWVVPRVLRGHVELLDALNGAIEVAKRPPEERGTFFDESRPRARNMTPYARLWLPALDKVGAADAREHARLRSAIAGLAVERYRLKYRRWPDTLDAIVPAFLPDVPTDPYDGHPLRYRRLPEGAVVYSVGADGQDDGGRLPEPGELPGKRGTDLGFRLWDVELRGQPAPPRPDNVPDNDDPFR